ncbi:MAG: MBL fold metallo-hydrolase [Acidobacteria bacterium]|nr:MBL fold metallo-hydrolase [Acidobacteriota bacterium]
MRKRCVVTVDLVDVWAKPGRKTLARTLAWGDEVVITKESARQLEVETVFFNELADGSILPVKVKGYIEPAASSKLKATSLVKPRTENDVLKVNFVDVQQGDGSVIEAPDGTVILVDGGDNQLFARYLAGRYRGTSLAKPKTIDCILVTHGDADHFSGLPEIQESETNKEPRKRLFIEPKRIYHNGIVKRPSTMNGTRTKEIALLGPTKVVDGQTYLTGLATNLLDVPDTELNEPFRKWKATLATYHARSPLTFRRLAFGDNAAFKFFNTDTMTIDVLGPLVTTVAGKPALPFLGNPPKGPRLGHESLDVANAPFKGHSASHTINGHSIVFRLSYGGFSYLFAGDLNDQASRFLAREHNAGRVNLRSEVFKVPHHGSADFSGAMFQAVAPVVSVVSSGDESARKEYIHPRATLMGALGKWSRVPEPLIFVTELVAFFNAEGYSLLAHPKTATQKARGEFYGFSRTAFGLVKTRTNGRRLFVYTDSGNVQQKEGYAYELDSSGVPVPAKVVRA